MWPDNDVFRIHYMVQIRSGVCAIAMVVVILRRHSCLRPALRCRRSFASRIATS